MSRLSCLFRASCAYAALLAGCPSAFAQSANPLPEVVVTATGGGSLTQPGVVQQRQELNKTAGSVGFVDSESFKDRYTNNLHDVLKDTPGVLVQERYGQELRLSIRGSAISRAFHGRGIEVLQDGIPFNNADGSSDFYQIDPLALRSIEVYKGGNGLAYESSYLGGAVNFVTPTAYTAIAPNILRFDGGSWGTARGNIQASRVLGNFDGLVNATYSHSDGYRDHARQDYQHYNANFGYRINPNVETRFWLGNYITNQKLPGSLTLADAINNPRMAAASAVTGDQARDVRLERISNRTTIRFDNGRLDLDSWAMHKNLYHPIFQVLDQDGWTYGFAPRYIGNFNIAGHRNELIAGVRYFGGSNKALQFLNVAGSRGAQTLNAVQDANNYQAFAENRFYFLPTVALMTGAKILRDERTYTDFGGLALNPVRKFDSRAYEGFNPKVGLLWEPQRDIQVFTNLTRSQDIPDFTDLAQTVATTTKFVPLAAQRAWTAEVGTRGNVDRFAWDVTLYRSQFQDELLQFVVGPGVPASTFNAPRTVHQGVELAWLSKSGATSPVYRAATN